jgi:hypothetical protein
MAAAAVQENPAAEVVCLFCGMRTPVPASRPAWRSANRVAPANFRVSIIRCHICGKEAPYQLSAPDAYGEESAKAAGAGAD